MQKKCQLNKDIYTCDSCKYCSLVKDYVFNNIYYMEPYWTNKMYCRREDGRVLGVMPWMGCKFFEPKK